MNMQLVSSGNPPAAFTKRCVIYLRVSTDKQAKKNEQDGFSLPAQEALCRYKAEQLGAEVVRVFRDKGKSAKTADRDDFQAMLDFVRARGDIDYVILEKIDRFARNRRDDANLSYELERIGVELISVQENIDRTPGGKLLHAILAGIAEYHSNNLSREVVKGMAQKAKFGGTPGLAPIGYLNVRRKLEDREIRVIEVDPERAPHIRWAFEAYATGEWTQVRLTAELDARGLRTLQRPGIPSAPLQLSRVDHMLGNRYYIGKVAFKGVEYDGTHEPLISEELFERVQIIQRIQ